MVVATVVDAAQSKAELEEAAAAAEAAIAPVREQLDAGIKTFEAKVRGGWRVGGVWAL